MLHPLVFRFQLFCNIFYPYYVNGSPLTKIFVYGYYIPVSLQIFTIIVISINRMTVLISPVSATQFWAKYIRHIIIGIVVTSLLFSFYVYDWGSRIDFLNGLDTLTVSFIDGWPYVRTVIHELALDSLGYNGGHNQPLLSSCHH